MSWASFGFPETLQPQAHTWWEGQLVIAQRTNINLASLGFGSRSAGLQCIVDVTPPISIAADFNGLVQGRESEKYVQTLLAFHYAGSWYFLLHRSFLSGPRTNLPAAYLPCAFPGALFGHDSVWDPGAHFRAQDSVLSPDSQFSYPWLHSKPS